MTCKLVVFDLQTCCKWTTNCIVFLYVCNLSCKSAAIYWFLHWHYDCKKWHFHITLQKYKHILEYMQIYFEHFKAGFAFKITPFAVNTNVLSPLIKFHDHIFCFFCYDAFIWYLYVCKLVFFLVWFIIWHYCVHLQ